MKKYHYTTISKIDSIIKSKVILQATANWDGNKKQQVVWLSTNPVWEETANKAIQWPNGGRTPLDRAGTAKEAGGLVRIEVIPESAPYTFEEYVKIAKVSRKLRNSLISTAKKMGSNPDDWFISFEPVRMDDWVDIEIYNWATQSWMSLFELEENKESILMKGA